MVIRAEIENWFKFKGTAAPTLAHSKISTAAIDFCVVLLDQTPSCEDQTAAIRKVRESVMTAYAAIDCGGR